MLNQIVSPVRSDIVIEVYMPPLTELIELSDTDFYKYAVPKGLRTLVISKTESVLAQHSVSRMQVVDGKRNERLPLASAICWKCCRLRKL